MISTTSERSSGRKYYMTSGATAIIKEKVFSLHQHLNLTSFPSFSVFPNSRHHSSAFYVCLFFACHCCFPSFSSSDPISGSLEESLGGRERLAFQPYCADTIFCGPNYNGHSRTMRVASNFADQMRNTASGRKGN